MKKIIVVSAIATSCLFVGAGVAQAGAQRPSPDRGYNQPEPETTTDDGTPDPGEEFEVTVVDCSPSTAVEFRYLGELQKQFADEDGSSSYTFTAPETSGTTSGTVTCDGRVMEFSVTVTAQLPPETVPAVTAPEEVLLPATGGGDNSMTSLTIGGLLLVLGAGLFGVAQRRRITR
ncbi:MAG: LPXTG cell wall anchor domain-containing protein [Ilumatobacteraceae bacterium]